MRRTPGAKRFQVAVAQSYAKLLAYKDEYEVARGCSQTPALAERIDEQFEGDYAACVPSLATAAFQNRPQHRKTEKTPIRTVARETAALACRAQKASGEHASDPFGYTAERRLERQLIVDYEQTVDLLLGTLSAENHALAVELAALPNEVRGYGPVKLERVRRMEERKKALIAKLDQPPKQQAA